MAALLDSVRRVPTNGFALWDSCHRLPLGREPPPAVALAMAQRIVAAYAVRWPASVRRLVTAERLVSELAARGKDTVFSARPALVAHVCSRIDDQGARAAKPEQALEKVLRAARTKLLQESSYDVSTLLLAMDDMDRFQLRQLADGKLTLTLGVADACQWPAGMPVDKAGDLDGADSSVTVEALLEESFHSGVNVGSLVSSLCEATLPLRLLPPYGKLVRSLVASDGAVTFEE